MAKGTVNKVTILGRLGQDPDVRATASGTQVVNLNVATNEFGPKDDSGMRQDVTEWHRCVLFGRTAEVAAQYLRKGSLVYLEGRLQTRKWQDQSGADRYSTEIVCFEMQLVGGRNDNTGDFSSQQPQGGYSQPSPQAAPQQGGYQAPQQPAQQPAQQPSQASPQYNQGGGFQQPQQPQRQAPSQPMAQPQQQPGGFDDFDDDIPF